MKRALVALGALLVTIALSYELYRVFDLAEQEASASSEDLDVKSGDVLVRIEARQGQQTLFQVCHQNGFASKQWESHRWELWHEGDNAKVSSHEVDEFKFRQNAPQCMTAFRGEMLADGKYALRVYSEAEVKDGMRATAKRWRILQTPDRAAPIMMLLGILLMFASLVRKDATEVERTPKLALLAFFLLIAAIFALAFLPIAGAKGGLLSGLLIAAVELGLVYAFSRNTHRKQLLAWRTSKWLIVAPFLGIALWFMGRLIAAQVPSTGTAPIEALVAWPSGMFAVASIGILAPVIEELFFRGLIYGHLVKDSKHSLAILVSFAAFAVVHLPQQWGAWGAFASVAFTGLMLTLLRRITKSTSVCALVHLTHNAVIGLVTLFLT